MGTLLACALLGLAAAASEARAADPAVVLNEINCEGTDWVEIVNTSDDPADISGWLLTDDPLTSTRADHRLLFAAGTTVPAQGALVVEKGAAGFPFGISCGSDTIRLADGAGNLADEIAVPSLVSSADTWGRYPNGSGSWLETTPTKGSPNQPSSATGGGNEDLAAWMFDPATVVEIDLDLPQESIDALAADPDEYRDATFSLTTTGGTYGPLNVGVHLKGGIGSFRPLSGKAAFKVKFNHSVAGQRFLGLKKLTLNNMVQDPSMIHEVLAYDVFRAAGVAAPRTGYAYVRVNGADYGLYLNLETLDDVSLPRWFDSTRHLYEGEYGSDVSPGAADSFEVDEGSDSDLSDLDALIAAVNEGGGDWSDRVAPFADLEQMTKMWAVEKYEGHWDGYAGGLNDPLHPNNFYLHSDAGGRFAMLPWGTDQTWDLRRSFDGRSTVLFNHCLDDASCAQLFYDAVLGVWTSVPGLSLDALAVETANRLRPWQELDPRREYSLEQIDAGVQSTRDFLAARQGDAAAWLFPPGPHISPSSFGSTPAAAPAQQVAGAQTREKKKRKPRHRRRGRHK